MIWQKYGGIQNMRHSGKRGGKSKEMNEQSKEMNE